MIFLQQLTSSYPPQLKSLDCGSTSVTMNLNFWIQFSSVWLFEWQVPVTLALALASPRTELAVIQSSQIYQFLLFNLVILPLLLLFSLTDSLLMVPGVPKKYTSLKSKMFVLRTD